MTREELNTIAAMTDQQIEPLTCVTLASVQAMITEKDRVHAEAVAALATVTEPLNTTIAELQAQVDALGGTEAGQRLAREKRRADLTRQRDEAIATAAKIEADLVEIDRD